MKILIVEDDPSIRRVIALALKSAGYETVEADTGNGGLDAARTCRPSLVLLDIMLPGMDGISVCRALRADSGTKALPVIMLTAKGEERDIVAGLDAGANDYVTKPFSKEVLLARIRAALRRDAEAAASAIGLDGLKIDGAAHQVFLSDEELKLTLSEYKILELLMRNRGQVFERSHIIDRISDGEKIVTDRTIDVQIVGLRRKLGDWARHIETIRGVGYRLE